MCFSAEVSFGSAATLLSVGAWCVRVAARKAPWFWPFAVVPCLFGLQQAAEGFVWFGLLRRDVGMVRVASGAYLFFALAFWPAWFSSAAALIEPDATRRRFLSAWAVLSSLWFWVVFLPALAEVDSPARVVRHSVRYEYADAGGNWREPPGTWVQRLLYAITAAAPLLASSRRRLLMIPVGASLVAAIVTAYISDHAFTSLWCLWSAVASAALARSVWVAADSRPG